MIDKHVIRTISFQVAPVYQFFACAPISSGSENPQKSWISRTRRACSPTSSIFPAGILVGEVSGVREDESFQTALTVNVEPQVHSSAVKEVFVILGNGGRE